MKGGDQALFLWKVHQLYPLSDVVFVDGSRNFEQEWVGCDLLHWIAALCGLHGSLQVRCLAMSAWRQGALTRLISFF